MIVREGRGGDEVSVFLNIVEAYKVARKIAFRKQ